MEKELFESLIKLCTLMCTRVPREYYNNDPCWNDIKSTIEKYNKLNPSNSGSLNLPYNPIPDMG